MITFEQNICKNLQFINGQCNNETGKLYNLTWYLTKSNHKYRLFLTNFDEKGIFELIMVFVTTLSL